jgi:hypothetical protein
MVAINITAVMQPIWDIIGNLVDNTGAIIGLVMIGVVIGIVYIVKRFLEGTLSGAVRR